MKKQLIARADDLGSSNSANKAIARVASAGVVRNVSVMACGPFVEEAAELFAHRKEICFGMHTTLNAEWDLVKWGPVSKVEPGDALVDEKGYFLSDPSLFLQTRPTVERVMREVEAQLERLHKLGFDIRYIDSHMFSEAYIAGMDEAMAEFARKKGLIDHMYFYHLLPDMQTLSEAPENLAAGLARVPAGQYFIVVHPSLDTEEMRRTGNAGISGEDVARGRAKETEIFSAPELKKALETAGITCIRYDEAAGERRMTVAELQLEMAKALESGG